MQRFGAILKALPDFSIKKNQIISKLIILEAFRMGFPNLSRINPLQGSLPASMNAVNKGTKEP